MDSKKDLESLNALPTGFRKWGVNPGLMVQIDSAGLEQGRGS